MKAKPGYVEPMIIVDIYAVMGEKDQAFAWLERAYKDRNPYLVALKSSPRLEILRSDPRYYDLVRRVGLS